MCIQRRKAQKGKMKYTVVPEIKTPNGKRNRKGCRTFDTLKDAQAYEIKILSEINNGTASIPSSVTFEQMANIWLETIRGSVAPSTMDGYQKIVKKHLLPVKVQEIKKAVPEKILNV